MEARLVEVAYDSLPRKFQRGKVRSGVRLTENGMGRVELSLHVAKESLQSEMGAKAVGRRNGDVNRLCVCVVPSQGRHGPMLVPLLYAQWALWRVASLVLLRPSLTSGSTVTSPTLAASATAYYNSGAGCTAPCYYTIALSGNPNDTNSSPFYTYTSTVSDTIFVGDDSGKLHAFTPVFNGAPTEVTTTGTRASGFQNWPATASSGTNPKLTSPVYDGGSSGLVFVEDATGYLNSINPGTPATPTTGYPGTVKTSKPGKGLWHCMACGKAGNAIQFVQAHDGVSFRHAFELLRQGGKAVFTAQPLTRQSTVPHLPCPLDAGADDAALLGQVVGLLPPTSERNAHGPRLSGEPGAGQRRTDWTVSRSGLPTGRLA